MASAEEPDAIASFLWASPPPKGTPNRNSSVTERFETVLSTAAVSQLVGGLTEKLKHLEEAKGREECRRQNLLSELSDTRTQLALTRSQLLRLELLAALFVVARLLTSSSLISSVSSVSISSLTETSTSICREVFDWVMVWMGGCSLIEGLIGVILVSQLVYLLVLDDMDPFASDKGGNDHTSNSLHTSNKVNEPVTPTKNVKGKKGGSLAGSDDLEQFIPKDAATALNAMHESSNLWTQPATFQDKNSGLAVWHRPIGAAVHEFKFTVDIQSEPAPVFALAREVELMSSWNPFIRTGLTLHYSPPPDGSIRAYLQIQLPWPLPKFAVVVSGKLFDCLDNSDDKSVVVVLGSEKEDGVAPEGLRPPSSPQEIRRLWMRVIAKAKPVRTCARNTPLHVTAGSCDKTRAKRGWFGGGSGGDDPSKPKTYFEVVAKLKFPIPAPGWVIRFIISTLAPLIVSKVQELLPTLMEPESEGSTPTHESFPSRMNKDRSLYGSLLTDKVRRAVPPTINT